MHEEDIPRAGQITAAATAFAALFSAVGIGLYGLTFFYDFFVKDYGWTRQQVTSGNAYAKLLIGPLFGYLAGYLIDRYGPRRLLLVGIVMAGGAMVGLGMLFAILNSILIFVLHLYYPYLYTIGAIFWWGGLWLVVTGQPKRSADGSPAPMWARAGLGACLVIGLIVGVLMIIIPWEPTG